MRFKQEIVESQVFDRLKFELGMKNFLTLIKEKLVPIPMDLVSHRFIFIVSIHAVYLISNFVNRFMSTSTCRPSCALRLLRI